VSTWTAEYWPFWFGAIALGGLVIYAWVAERRLLAGSGSFTRISTALQTGDWGVAEERLLDDSEAVDAALLAATLAQFPDADIPTDDGPPPPVKVRRTWAPAYAHLIFLAMVAVGGFVGATEMGALDFGWSLGSAHADLVGEGGIGVVALAIGGMFTGFGTRMSSGCTTGHGLCGNARFQPGSLVATGAFFGTAIVVSFVLEALA
jgi:uncharacterized membrane protein YedE/YeeE